MGIFSRKKTITVSSSCYNLAGDQKDRAQYLPTVVIGDILAPSSRGLGEVIVNSLLAGPGIRMRGFARWARTSGYTGLVQQASSRINVGDSIDTEVLLTQLPIVAGGTPILQTAETDTAEFSYWAERWLLANHPELINAEYELDYSEDLNTIYINLPLGLVYSFVPADFDTTKRYLYVSYKYQFPGYSEAVLPGTITQVTSPSEFPPTSGWTDNGITVTNQPTTLDTVVDVVVSYSDARPNETSSNTTTASANIRTEVQELETTVYKGILPTDPHKVTSLRSIQYQTSTQTILQTPEVVVTTETIAAGVIKTTTTTTTTDSLVLSYSYILDTQVVVLKVWSDMNILIYPEAGNNPVLNAMFGVGADAGTFFPFVPMRYRNTFLSPSYHGDTFTASQRAVKKATGSKYAKIETGLKTTPSLGDIDHAYLVFGVSLNVRERSARKYLYKFFEHILSFASAGGTTAQQTWDIAWRQADVSKQSWLSWVAAQATPTDPLFGTQEPTVLPYPPMPVKQMNLMSHKWSYGMYILWTGLSESTGTGLGRVGAKKGDVWIVQGATADYVEAVESAGISGTRTLSNELTNIVWQDQNDSYRTMHIWGLRHQNTVYKGKSVKISAKQALDDPEESGFIIPLHEGIFRAMSLKDTTQMASANSYLVLNSYTVVKQKWYETTLFKIILVIIIIVVSIFYPPAAGLLGPALTVGAAVGLTGVTALVVGTIVNALAAMILTKLLTVASTALFGDRIGAIVGAIASIAALAYVGGVSSGQGFAAGFGDMSSAQNIMKLTVAAGDGYTGYLSDKTAKIVADSQKILADYTRKSKEIADKYYKDFGDKGAVIDPMSLLGTPEASSFFPETPSMFLSRTLMTGSDVVAMSQDLLTNFTSLSTALPQ